MTSFSYVNEPLNRGVLVFVSPHRVLEAWRQGLNIYSGDWMILLSCSLRTTEYLKPSSVGMQKRGTVFTRQGSLVVYQEQAADRGSSSDDCDAQVKYSCPLVVWL